ncbi:MAG: hypothetical protein CM15mV28_1090 [Thaumasvirus sp.]|nr:MAG: hypothetical protein CM15mV28_1090 [Thaumasvirus sp.]
MEFNVRGKTKQQLAAEFFARCKGILIAEEVTFSEKVVAEVVQNIFQTSEGLLMSCNDMQAQDLLILES